MGLLPLVPAPSFPEWPLANAKGHMYGRNQKILRKVPLPKGEWSVTFVPLGYAIAPTESSEPCEHLIHAVSDRLSNSFGIDLQQRVCALYLDGGKALDAAFSRTFPARTTDCRCSNFLYFKQIFIII